MQDVFRQHYLCHGWPLDELLSLFPLRGDICLWANCYFCALSGLVNGGEFRALLRGRNIG